MSRFTIYLLPAGVGDEVSIGSCVWVLLVYVRVLLVYVRVLLVCVRVCVLKDAEVLWIEVCMSHDNSKRIYTEQLTAWAYP